MEEQTPKRRGRPRKNVIENTTSTADTSTATVQVESLPPVADASVTAAATVEVAFSAEPEDKKFMPYIGKDKLPLPAKGKIYGRPRFFVQNGRELISIRKKSVGGGYLVTQELFANLNSKSAKNAGLKKILKECDIPGVA